MKQHKTTRVQRIIAMLCTLTILLSIGTVPLEALAVGAVNERSRTNWQERSVRTEGQPEQTAQEPDRPKDIPITDITDPVNEYTLDLSDPEKISVQLTPAVAPQGYTEQLIWASQPSDIVYVKQDGTITAAAPGDATVTVSAHSSPQIKKEYAIHVVKSVTSVELNQYTLQMKPGDVFTLEATVVPQDATDAAVVWESSPQGIVSVEHGRVQALANGTAKITATAGNNVQAVCEVSVTTAAQSVTIENKPVQDQMVYGSTHKLTCRVEPSTASQTPEWAVVSGDAVTVEPSTGLLTAVKAGKATVKVAAGAAMDEYQVTVLPKVIRVTGITMQDKPYDGTAAVPQTLQGQVTFDALVGGDSIALSHVKYGDTSAVHAQDIPRYITVDLKDAVLDNPNYILDKQASIAQTSIKIVKKQLSAAGLTGIDGTAPRYTAQTTYDGLTVALEGIADTDSWLPREIQNVTARADDRPVVLPQGSPVQLQYDRADTKAYQENYILPSDAQLLLAPAELSADVLGGTKEYDGTVSAAQEFSAQLYDVLGDDEVIPVVANSAYLDANVSQEAPITAQVSLEGADCANYTLPGANIRFIPGKITKTDRSVVLQVSINPDVADPDTRLNVEIDAKGRLDHKGKAARLNGSAVVNYQTPNGAQQVSTEVRDGKGQAVILAMPGEQMVEVVFTIAENELNYQGTHTQTAVYNKGYQVQELKGEPVKSAVYGTPVKLELQAVEQTSEAPTGASITYASNNTAAAVIDSKTGEIRVVDVEAAREDGYQVIFTAKAEAVAGKYNGSYLYEYPVALEKRQVTPSIQCAEKSYDGTNTAYVSGKLEGLVEGDEAVGLSNTDDGQLKGAYEKSDVGTYRVTAEGLVPCGETKDKVPGENNYTLAVTAASCEGTIVPRDISQNGDAELTLKLDGDGFMYYTGTPRRPRAAVTIDLNQDGRKETTLWDTTDYTLEYADHTDVSINGAKVKVTGTGNYTGELTASFSIRYKKVPSDAVLLTVKGRNGGKPAPERRYPQDAQNGELWYNSDIEITAAEGYTFDDQKPTTGTQLFQTKRYTQDGLDIFENTHFYVREDVTGHVFRIRLGDQIHIDRVAPKLTQVISTVSGGQYPEGDYYNTSFTTTFVVEEENYNKEGINSAFRVQAGTDVQTYQDAPVQTVVSADTRQKNNISVTVDAGSGIIAGETHIPYVVVVDPAGNPLVVGEGVDADCKDGKAFAKTKKIVDTKPPEAVIRYPQLDAVHYYENEAYYNTDLVASFAFTDENGIDLQRVKKVAEVTHGSQFAPVDASPSGEQDTITVPAVQENNGHYQFGAYGTDKAGNPLTVKEMQTQPAQEGAAAPAVITHSLTAKEPSIYHKVLDTIAPQAVLTIDAHDALRKHLQPEYNHRYYFNDRFDAQFSITETNYDASKVTVRYGQVNSIEVMDSGNTLSTQKVEPCVELHTQQTESPYRYTQSAGSDGVYVFDIKGVDRAGNPIEMDGSLLENSIETQAEDKTAHSEEPTRRFTSYVIAQDKINPVLDIFMRDENNNGNGYNPQTGNFFEATLFTSGDAAQPDLYQIHTNWPYRSSKTAEFGFTTNDQSPVAVMYTVDSSAPQSSFAYKPQGLEGYAGTGGTAPKDVYHDGLSGIRSIVENEQVLQIGTLMAEDLAGNKVSYVKHEQENRIYFDVQAPTDDQLQPVIRLRCPDPAAYNTQSHRPSEKAGLYRDTVVIEADVMDPYTAPKQDEYAKGTGLYRVYYQVTVRGSEAAAQNVSIQTSSGKPVAAGPDGVFYVDYSTTGQSGPVQGSEVLTEQDTLTFTFDPKTADGVFNCNSIELSVWAVDNANNGIHQHNKASYTFGIDVTQPVIAVRYDNNDALNDKYFKNDRTAVITVTERNFDPSKIEIATESGARSAWTYHAGAAVNGDQDQWSCTVDYTADGVYTLSVSGEDQLGLPAASITYEGAAAQNFVLDKTAPVVRVSFDNTDVRNGKYYNRSRTAAVEVDDVNFNGVNEIQVAALLGGAAPQVAFAGKTAVVPFEADGTYSMSGTVTDMAGNRSEGFSVEEFVIDKTAPELEIEGVQDAAAYADVIQPRVVFRDQNYDAGTTSLLRSVWNRHGEDVSQQIVPVPSVASAENGVDSGVLAYEDLAHVPENDGLYTLTATVTDLAGNAAEKTVRYSVNRFGTVYVYSPALKEMIGQYRQEAGQELYIMGYNVTPLVEGTAKMQITCDGAMLETQSGTQAQPQPQTSQGGWHAYRFDISPEDLKADGRYEITVSDKDQSGNTKTNADDPIWFYVDATKPALDSVVGLENSIVNAKEHTIRYIASDAVAMKSIEVYVNDALVQTVDRFDGAAYEDSFTVPAGVRQKVRMVLTDKAGNVLDTDRDDFAPSYPFHRELTVSTNFFVRWYANAAVFWGSIAAIVLVTAGLIVLLFAKRRKKEQAAE